MNPLTDTERRFLAVWHLENCAVGSQTLCLECAAAEALIQRDNAADRKARRVSRGPRCAARIIVRSGQEWTGRRCLKKARVIVDHVPMCDKCSKRSNRRRNHHAS